MNKKLIEFAISINSHLISHINTICSIADRHIIADCPIGAKYPLYTNYKGFSDTKADESYIYVRDIIPAEEHLDHATMQSACVYNSENINEIVDGSHEFSCCWRNTIGAIQNLALRELYKNDTDETNISAVKIQKDQIER